MTNEKALEWLKYLLQMNRNYYDNTTINALEVAIKSLEQSIAIETALKELMNK